MSQRFYVYPLLFIVLMQLGPLLRPALVRWHAAQIVQLLLVLLATAGAFYFTDDPVWVALAWVLFGLFVVVPRVFAQQALHRQVRAQWHKAARLRRWAGFWAWGQLGLLYRAYATALDHLADGNRSAAVQVLDGLAARPMPEAMRGAVRLWKLSALVSCRAWPEAIAHYEAVEEWGTLIAATHARLNAARAFAELGQADRALRSLQFVMLSPRTLGPVEAQLWMVRVSVAALAGDGAELEHLLAGPPGRVPNFARFTAYWRGRCAWAAGDAAGAAGQLTRALALTKPDETMWRDVIGECLAKADGQNRLPAAPVVAAGEAYRHGQEVLHMAGQQTAAWRALMHLGRPAALTYVLLLLFATIYLADEFLFTKLWHPLYWWAGNGWYTFHEREWWRLFTALFLHANPLHLAMNGAALWMFGSAIEKALGRWRFVVLFVVAGVAGNFLSAWRAEYDVAIGASGGVFGLVGAFAVAVYRLDAPMYAAARRRLLAMLVLMVAADMTVGWLEPQVDNLAHVGGFIAGIGLALLLHRPPAPRVRRNHEPAPTPHR